MNISIGVVVLDGITPISGVSIRSIRNVVLAMIDVRFAWVFLLMLVVDLTQEAPDDIDLSLLVTVVMELMTRTLCARGGPLLVLSRLFLVLMVMTAFTALKKLVSSRVKMATSTVTMIRGLLAKVLRRLMWLSRFRLGRSNRLDVGIVGMPSV